ncbi:MAG: hypothetical protein ACE5ER_02255 [Nitrospinaceae bacterium]
MGAPRRPLFFKGGSRPKPIIRSALKIVRSGEKFWTAFLFVGILAAGSDANPLEIVTRAEVSEKGKVVIHLRLKNIGTTPLHQLHPMFHFHHSMIRLQHVPRLDPGQTVERINHDHPPMRRTGSYPLVAFVRFKEAAAAPNFVTWVHADTFYFRRPLPTRIEGRIETSVQGETSRLKVHLRNATPSFKNLRLNLLLPPELKPEGFTGMMGITLRGDEETYFEIPVKKVDGLPGGRFPVHLLVEYGEMLNHYSGAITGSIDFGPRWSRSPFWAQMLVFLFLAGGVIMALRRHFKFSS